MSLNLFFLILQINKFYRIEKLKQNSLAPDPDRLGRTVPHQERGGDSRRHPGPGPEAPQLVHGRKNLHRLRDHDEQRA